MSTPKRHNPRKAGRKTKFRPEYVAQVTVLIRAGKNLTECQKFFGISRPQWAYWKEQNPAFKAALEESMAQRIIDVENSLFQRARGYSYVESTVEVSETDKGTRKVCKKITKHVAGDVAAQKFFLTNRHSGQWKDRTENKVEHRGQIVFKLSEQDLKA